MTKEEQDHATSDKVLELYEQCTNRAYGRQNVPVREFKDAQTSLALVEWEVSPFGTRDERHTNILLHQLSTLHNRTEVEVLLVVTWGNQQSYVQPYSFITCNPVKDFIVATHGCTVEDLSVAMEGFLLGKMSNSKPSSPLDLRSVLMARSKGVRAKHPESNLMSQERSGQHHRQEPQ